MSRRNRRKSQNKRSKQNNSRRSNKSNNKGSNNKNVEKKRSEHRIELEREKRKKQVFAQLDRGKTFKGKVKSLTNFGAFVDLGGIEGLLHISEIAPHRVNRVEDHLKVGDEIEVKLLKIGPDGKLDLSRKAVLNKERKES